MTGEGTRVFRFAAVAAGVYAIALDISGYGGFSVPDNFALAAMAQNFPTGFAARFDDDFLFALDPWEEGVPCPPEMPKDFRRRP